VSDDQAVAEIPSESGDLQREVQRKLGRCMLRIQQYERLMKSLLASHALAGPASKLEAIRAKRADVLATKSLGQLVGELTGSFLTAGPDEAESESSPEAPTGVWLAMRMKLEMTQESYQQTVDQLSGVVVLRNDLVHHLIERYDLWSKEGCIAALGHLETSYDRIDEAFLTLQHWSSSMREAAAKSAAFMATPMWEDMVVHGIEPDGNVDWPRSTIVELLRSQSPRSPNGWCSLEAVMAALGQQHPDQTPKRYGCTSWRQVLHRSGQFLIRRDKGTAEAPGQTWFRPRTTTT
jgi:hypothetical protein